jgi:hypothetical protein
LFSTPVTHPRFWAQTSFDADYRDAELTVREAAKLQQAP